MAAAKPIAFDVQRLIDEVAARHRLLLKPDDAAFAIVTMNRLVLEESLEAIHSLIQEDLFEAAAKKCKPARDFSCGGGPRVRSRNSTGA